MKNTKEFQKALNRYLLLHTVTELAKKVSLNKSTITRIKNGERDNIRNDNYRLIFSEIKEMFNTPERLRQIARELLQLAKIIEKAK